MFKIIIGIILFGLCSFVGIKIRQQFSKREKFYHDLSSFCLFLREQINFSKAPLPQIAEKFQLNCSKDFAQVLDGLKGGINGEYPKYLKEKGKVEIKSFFDRLGKSDLDSQLRLIDEHKRKIDFVYETAKNDKKKKGELGYKLSLMAGIALLIILA